MRLVAGFGSRRAAPLRELQAALDAALAAEGRSLAEVALLAALEGHAEAEPLAARLSLPLRVVPQALAGAQRVITDSAASRAATGLGSVAEAVALAAAGPGARLLGPRQASRAATCALAEVAA
jgi:cobalamin biosynthesis protein CbiG